MSRNIVFDSPFLLGFDHLERMLESAAKASAEGYPPYNIEQIGENRLRISLAVAGFNMDDLSVSVEDAQLVVRGKCSQSDKGRVFIHRGIAKRQFQRTFVLAEGIEISGAIMDNGLLHVDMDRPVHEPEVRTIAIEKADPSPANTKTIDIEAEE
ncbi:MAG: Hsp20 family protein [Rhodospirillaceae bacterium]|nr:Hsp20 family protein [Rhodospirillaceae bacterium]MCK5546912.1 Hsp20 family protein [Rhodospirillaceae bacterium]